MNWNGFVNWILHSPLYGLMGNTMLITVTGRSTGRKYTTPVNYMRENGTLWILSSRDRTWWRNACGADVNLHLQGRDLAGRAEAVLDERAVALHLVDYIRRAPMSAKPLGVRMQQGLPNVEDVERVARDRLFIKVQPAGL